MATKKQKSALRKARCVTRYIAKHRGKKLLARARRVCKVKGYGKKRRRSRR